MATARVAVIFGGSGIVGSGVIKALLEKPKDRGARLFKNVYLVVNYSSQDCRGDNKRREDRRDQTKIWKSSRRQITSCGRHCR